MSPEEIRENVNKYFDSSWVKIIDQSPKYILAKDYSKYEIVGCPDLGRCRVVVCGDVNYDGDSAGSAEIVLYFEDHDVFIKKEGYYTSYDGYDFDGDLRIVRPRQKTITYYE